MRSDLALLLRDQVGDEEVKDAAQKYHIFGDDDPYRLQSAARKCCEEPQSRDSRLLSHSDLGRSHCAREPPH
jgi:hypothetical protein